MSESRTTPAQDEFLNARQAAELLGVKLPTIYAYTSRGLIQSVPGGRGRARLYRRRDIERLCARRDARAGHGPVAAAALRQGEPVLDSSITLILHDRGPIYRGRAALELAAEGRSFEWVAEGLWSGDWSERPEPTGWQPDGLGLDLDALLKILPPRVEPLSVLTQIIPLLAARDPARFSWNSNDVLRHSRVLLRRCVAVLAIGRHDEVEAAEAINRSLAAPNSAAAIAAAFSKDLDERALSALNQALVVTADHELNASAFAARVVASTGADIYGCISAALAALSGPRHGGAADRLNRLLREGGSAQSLIAEQHRRGEVIEGFGHPIYAPHNDPRGELLVDIARGFDRSRGPVESVLELVDAMREGGFGGPSIDVGLVAIARALDLPLGSATALFAIGRSVGWVAHALEQYEAGYLVRPRARYRDDRRPGAES